MNNYELNCSVYLCLGTTAVIDFLLAMNKRSKSPLPHYNTEEDFEFFHKLFETSCKWIKFDDKTDYCIADLKNQLRRSEIDLMLANKKIAMYEKVNAMMKIELEIYVQNYENSIIEERLQRNNDNLEMKMKSYQDKEEDNKKLIASLEAQLKEKDDHITLLELGHNLDTLKLKEKDDLLREQAANIEPKYN